MNCREIIKILLSIILITIVVIFVILDGDRIGLSESVKVGKEQVNIYESEEGKYIFLPSFASEDNTEIGKMAGDQNLHVLQSANIPAMFITTKSGSLDRVYENPDYRETGSITVYDTDGSVDFSGKLHKLTGRGNYSWSNWDKKSFSIDIGDHKKMLGLSNGGGYALIANASDPTLIRNELAREMEAAIGMEYTFLGQFVDLYIDGEYLGNYYVCPKLSVGQGRIDITNLEEEMDRIYSKADYSRFDVYETTDIKGWNLEQEPNDYTGGYLFEREFISRYETEYGKNPSGFETVEGECFVVKSPKYCSKNQINYLAEYINKTEESIHGKGDYTKYIDISSWAKWYVVNEVTKNYDAGVSSAYFYKDSDSIDGKIHMASGWDYDMSMGNYLEWMEYNAQGPLGITKLNGAESSSNWYALLYEQDDFREAVIHEYHTLENYLDWIIDEKIIDYKNKLDSSAQMDGVRWKTMYENNGYMVGDVGQYEELRTFLRLRTEYLAEEWK